MFSSCSSRSTPLNLAPVNPCSIFLFEHSAIFHFFNYFFDGLFAGISLKTQELYAIVFATRYLDIFTDFISFYNTIMKLIFLGSSFSIVWYMRHHKIVRRSYNKGQDTFRHFFLILPCLLLALLINEKFSFKEVRLLSFMLSSISLYLFILSLILLICFCNELGRLCGHFQFISKLLQYFLSLYSYRGLEILTI